MTLRTMNLDAFRATPLTREPFEYLTVPNFLNPEACAAINRDYPKIGESGSFPVAHLSFGPAFQNLLDEMASEEFRAAFAEKFNVDLTGRPHTITVRGRCSPKDGRIHTDTKSKILTLLIYMNPEWEHSGGRLRLLKSDASLDDPIMEVPPAAGALLAFKRSDNSWHGHKPFDGERRVIQFNWVTSEGDRRVAMLRHHLSATVKRLFGKTPEQPYA
ncbi:2OG-Fe(II) oxygenase [Rhodoblastus sp.]|uniref:2OG-Fe(II) oxygenase n=1 Tax=Rhodoblastus sp. TaxID=1962975 RepID=UPI003F9BF7AB